MFFSPIWTIFELVRCFDYKTASPTGGQNFNRPETLLNSTNIYLRQKLWKSYMKIEHDKTYIVFTRFELDRGIIWANLLTKFHEDQTRNVASRMFTNQMWTGGRTDGRTTDKDRSQKLT
ncbi:hypothetical protein DPMN_149607 [Dreissena polymorpha]|uniref:Uncharacterized protein n=1 Tax=Dreissena polymorpha TaxID=45954 RepID=A0A9D4FBY2_DREPO|nr:hypothetical protein DPMN_149607 [Dreissena polymorpha]